jgi:MoxR-like ATPase
MPEQKEDISLQEAKKCADTIEKIKAEVKKVVVGQEKIVDSLIKGLLCEGHVLLEGVPGVAKTLMVRALAAASGCDAKRIQFTVDLLPTDIVGLTSFTKEGKFETIKGPIFTNFLLADEINRSPPKTQSALLEAMQEKIVTIGKETFSLSNPFFVMATENPLESSGVYFLPEAQIDRFLFKVIVGYPKKDEEQRIMRQNMTLRLFEDYGLKAITNPQQLIQMQEITKRVYTGPDIEKYIVDIVGLTRQKEGYEEAKYVEWGGSPRATIGIFIASKAHALISGRKFVTPDDVKSVVHDVLRHRIILNYAAQAEGITSDYIIDKILEIVPAP